MAIYSGFTRWKWWFLIVMLNYQRVKWSIWLSLINFSSCRDHSRLSKWPKNGIGTVIAFQRSRLHNANVIFFSFLFTVFYKNISTSHPKSRPKFLYIPSSGGPDFFSKCTLELLRSSRISPPLPTAPVRCNAPRDPTWCALVFRWPFPSKKNRVIIGIESRESTIRA